MHIDCSKCTWWNAINKVIKMFQQTSIFEKLNYPSGITRISVLCEQIQKIQWIKSSKQFVKSNFTILRSYVILRLLCHQGYWSKKSELNWSTLPSLHKQDSSFHFLIATLNLPMVSDSFKCAVMVSLTLRQRYLILSEPWLTLLIFGTQTSD